MSLLQVLLAGPTYTALTGERKRAFVRQWVISIAVLLAMVGLTVVLLTTQGDVPHRSSVKQNILVTTAVLLGAQFCYALIRRETIWQLRVREWRANSAKSSANLADLHDFADTLQKRSRQ